MNTMDRFKLTEKTCIITGGCGLLGVKHAEAVLDAGGIPILLDINEDRLDNASKELTGRYEVEVPYFKCDITNKAELEQICKTIIEKYHKIDILINNAANNPKVEDGATNISWSRFENFSLDNWLNDISVGLTGAFFCSQVFGSKMAEQKSGVILNISSDLGIIAPDQRLYRKEGLEEQQQNVKPVTYSVIKHGLLGLTKYLATYWADKGVRVNAICPGGVYNNQDDGFYIKLTNLIPLGRMADVEEYKGAILFMISDASSYMTGSTVIVDGGRTCW